MATLFNTKISATYVGLLKTIDNAVLNATLRELTDGSGNQSGLFLNTAGDFKVTSVLEWGSLKDTGTGVTITQFVTAANGIQNFNNDTTVPTSAAVKLYVDTKFSQTDTLAEVLSFGNTTGATNIVIQKSIQLPTTTTNNGTPTDVGVISFGGTFSNGNRIFNDATGGNLRIQGTDNLSLFAPNHKISNVNGSLIIAGDTGVKLFYQNSQKLQTTTSGIDVTGNLVVSGTITGSGGSFLPLAGGTMTGNIVLNDNVKSIYGTSSDGLEIYHDGSNSYIADTGTGTLNLRGSTQVLISGANGEVGVQYVENAGVNLRHNNIQKLGTSSAGVDVTGTLSTTSNVTVGANATFVDNGKAIFGAGSDLQIYHDGSNSYINEQGTGNLYLKATSLILSNSAGSNYLIGNSGGSVNMYFNGSEKLGTRTDGAKVTGNLEVTGTITGSGGSFLPLAGGTMTGNTIHNDNVKSIYGTGSDFSIYHDGSNSYIQDTSGTGDLIIDTNTFRLRSANGGETMIRAFEDGAVILSHNNLDKLTTTSTGISVTGNVVPTANVHIQDAGQLQLGTGINGKIYHDGNNFIANNLTGDLYIDQAAVTKSIFFRVSNANALDTTALTINREGDLTTGADVTIAGNLTVNGTTTTINTQTLAVEDPLIELSKDNAANSVDIGFYGKYNDGTARYLGLFSDASDSNKFRLFKGTTVQPTTTVNIAGAGYVAADLQVAGLEATTGSFTGNIIVDTNANALLTLDGSSGSTEGIIIKHSGTEVSRISHSNSTSLVFSTGSSVTAALTLNAAQLATFGGNVNLADNKKLRFGTGEDLQIYHDSANSYIQTSTGSSGDLYIQSQGTGHDLYLQATDDIFIRPQGGNNGIKVIGQAGVELYYNNVKKFETTNSGVSVTGIGQFSGGISASDITTSTIQLNGDFNVLNKVQSSYITLADRDTSGSEVVYNLANVGSATFAGNVSLGDNKELIFGAASDYKIYHNSTTNVNHISSFIDRQLSINANNIFLTNQANNSTFLLLNSTGATFGGNIASTATSFLMNFNVTDNSTFFSIDHTGNENWAFKCESIGGSNDAITIGTSTGTIEIDESGQIFSHQKLDVATAGGRLTGKSNRGYLASVHLEQVATGADGGEIYFMTAPNGTTAGTRKLEISSAGEVILGTGTNNAGFLDFDSTNLQFNTQRNPNTGAFVDTNKSHAHIGLQGANGGSQIIFGTAAANNTVATERMRISSDGKSTFTTDTGVLIKGASGSVSAKISFLPASGGRQYDLGNVGADFRIFDASANITRMYFDNDKNTGINTITPRGRLEIFREAGASSIPQLVLGTGESGSENYSLSTDVTAAGDFCIVKGSTNTASNVIMKIVSSGITTFNGFADGDKIQWTKDNALVGSVGTYNGVPYIGYQGGAGGGIMFNGSSIEPTALGFNRSSNTNDIGSANHQWRNAYLGGGVFLGGTGTANKLDDYEEGTWTPAIYYQNSTDAGNATNTTQTGVYTKIGNKVFVQFRLIWTITGTPATDNCGIQGIPFTAQSTSNNSTYAEVPCILKGYSNPSTGGRGTLTMTLPTSGQSKALFNDSNMIGNMGQVIGAGTHEIRFSFTYTTDQ